MKRNDAVCLQHRPDVIRKVEPHLLDVDEVSIFANSLGQDGVIR